MSDWLNETKFIDVIDSAPLVSIDLLLLHENKVLLGKRLNRPAQSFWFGLCRAVEFAKTSRWKRLFNA